MYTILVQMADDKWTTEALHLACALARSISAQVVLLRLVPVTHAGYLGTTFGNKPPSESEYRSMKEFTATAEDYGIELAVQSMQCLSTMDALVEAAESLDAMIVFARVQPSRIAYWRRFLVWNLSRRLASQKRQLFTLDQPVGFLEWMPTITVRAVLSDHVPAKLPHLPVQE